MPNANFPTTHLTLEIPGIDDCDLLLSATTRDSLTSIYLKLQEFEWEGEKHWAGAALIDCDKAHFCDDLATKLHFFNLKQAAQWLQETAREHFKKNTFAYDFETRKLLR